MSKVNKINATEVPSIVQDTLEEHYFLYEIEDIISALSKVIADAVINSNEIKLKGLGTFKIKKGACRNFISGLTGESFTKTTKNSVIFKPDAGLIEKLNK